MRPSRWSLGAAIAGIVLALGALLALLPAPLRAAPPPTLEEPRFHGIANSDSIPHGVVSALTQDGAGFLWVGTSAGLLRFDGYRFRHFVGQFSGGRPQLGGSFIRSLLVARDGRLWIGTDSDGLASLDPLTERITMHRGDASSPGALAAGTVRALAEDRDGSLWVGTIGHGLDRFEPGSGRVEHHRATGTAGALVDDRVSALLVDRRGTLWVGTWNGLMRRPAGARAFEPVFSAPGGEPTLARRIVTRVFEPQDGRIWVGTQQGDLAVIDAATGQGRLLAPAPDGNPGAVYDIVGAPPQQVWVARASGIEVRAADDGRLLRRLRHEPGNANSLAGNEVRALLRDRAGWLWAGGYGGGLQRHDPGNTSIRVRRHDSGHGGVLADPNVRSVLQLASGEIWLGTQENGIAILDAELNLVGALPSAPGSPRGLGGGRIGSLAQTADGSVWVGSDAGLYQVRPDRQLLRMHQAGNGRARRLLPARDGGLWIATQDGLFRHDPASGRITRLPTQGAQELRGDVNALAEAADGTLWIGAENGLYVLPAGAPAMLPVAAAEHEALAHRSVLGLLIDRAGRLWIDTPAGLHRLQRWDGRQAAFERTAERHGFGGQSFGANLLEDGRGRIWTHIAMFDPQSGHHHLLTAADGVDIGTGWFRAYARTADGRLLFGGSKGLLVVRPEAFDGWTYAPPLVVSELRIDGQVHSAGALAKGLTLTPGQRSFSIEFAALDYSDPSRSRYAYRLEGFDRDWIGTRADYRVASYSNLAPGRYTLHVRGTNRSGVFSSKELAIAVQVQPEWWQTWWARGLGLVGAALLVLAVVQLRTALLRRQRLALEQKVSERTAELEAMSQALQRQTAALEDASLSDPLTGLRNRRFLTQHIDGDAALARRQTESDQGAGAALDADLVFFMVDLDHFKHVNDEYGHSAGDAVLVQTAQRLRQVFREADYLVRWGGEEFLIVARGTERGQAPELAERARAMIADEPFVLPDGTRLHRSCSVGFAGFPLSRRFPRTLEWSAVVDVADAALYSAKRAGRNRWFGVLEAHSPSAERLREGARGAFADWVASGELQVQQSHPTDVAPS